MNICFNGCLVDWRSSIDHPEAMFDEGMLAAESEQEYE